ncbi:2'-5' RNA ligase family protein [Paenibacillus sp. y28]|uniref:2'-5' RNA ligase family protein n=1 Tax=Paenibacillus sp. y28 TaxID=3129110 RepID=UPI00301A848B
MKYGIAVFPPKSIQDTANSLRKRYDPNYSLIPPHLTVREAGETDETGLQHIISHLNQLTAELAPFPITFNRFSTFYPVNPVIYMATADPEPFRRLHRKVCSGPLEVANPRYEFHPHLTIGQNLNNDELHDVLASLRNRPIDLTFIADRLHLLYQTDNRAWTTHQTFLLQGTPI